jgi:fumarate reductase subunit D
LVIPISVAILIGLFLIQRHGTARVGAIFGPIMLVYFAVLAGLGALNVARHPEIVAILNPWWAYNFFRVDIHLAFLALGSVVLAVTGAETLYADMGHFGRKAVSVSWLYLVFPCLIVNYMGQGALMLDNPAAAENPFYLLAPEWARLPLVLLATIATVIASQAVISGAYSVTQQAVQLGFLPRVRIAHTSDKAVGQIYVPIVNWGLLIVEQSRGGLWDRGHRHDVHHRLHDRRAHLQRLALEQIARRPRHRRLPADRRRLFRVQPHQDPGRRLVPVAGRRHRLHPAHHLGDRPAHIARADARKLDADGGLPQDLHRVGEARSRHRRLHGGGPRWRAPRAAAQYEAQQGAARARDHHHRRDRRRALCRSGRPDRGS